MSTLKLLRLRKKLCVPRMTSLLLKHELHFSPPRLSLYFPTLTIYTCCHFLCRPLLLCLHHLLLCSLSIHTITCWSEQPGADGGKNATVTCLKRTQSHRNMEEMHELGPNCSNLLKGLQSKYSWLFYYGSSVSDQARVSSLYFNNTKKIK